MAMLDGDFNFLNMPQSRLIFTLISLYHIQDATWWLRFHDDAFDIIATFRIIISKHFTLSAHFKLFPLSRFFILRKQKEVSNAMHRYQLACALDQEVGMRSPRAKTILAICKSRLVTWRAANRIRRVARYWLTALSPSLILSTLVLES